MKGVVISGDRSGSGKTSVTLALAALLARDRTVQTFKVGMDYIDPSYLSAVTGRPCRNLDGFVLSGAENRAIFNAANRGADLAIVEGVRGLYRRGRGDRRRGLHGRDCEAPRPPGRARRERPLDHALGGRARPRVPVPRPGASRSQG